MKQFYTLISALFLLAFSAQAQVTIYHENFSGSVTGITGTNWGSSTTNSSNNELASGGANYITSTSTSNEKRLVLSNNISTIGFKSVSISWSEYRSELNNGQSASLNGNPVRLYYRIGATGAYKEVTSISQQKITFNQWTKFNGGANVVLPAECNNASNLSFYWSYTNNVFKNDFYAIDDITIVGTPDEDPTTAENDLSTLNWSNIALNEDPFAAGKSYTVDENAVTFTKTVGAGVTLTKSAVSNTDFQNPVRSLTLLQTGASSTVGTTIKIAFASPVADLTFTLFDIDQASGQFQDRVVIKGIGFNGQEVALTKTRVRTTFNNSFNTATSAVTGVSGADVAAATNGGNMTVTFNQLVAGVTIQYLNLDSNRGNQGIAIHNLYWRRERAAAPLPVELMYFKGAVQGKNANLTWATAQEIDNEKFVVERSLDGKNFNEIGVVKGNGNSSSRINYSFTDTNPAEGVNYYRLRQVDFSGTEETSNVVALQYKGAAQNLNGNIAKVYPTIASSEVNVSLAVSNAQITVLDANGRQVAQYSNVSQDVVVPTASLQPGMYFVKVSDGTQHQTQRFVKQ